MSRASCKSPNEGHFYMVVAHIFISQISRVSARENNSFRILWVEKCQKYEEHRTAKAWMFNDLGQRNVHKYNEIRPEKNSTPHIFARETCKSITNIGQGTNHFSKILCPNKPKTSQRYSEWCFSGRKDPRLGNRGFWVPWGRVLGASGAS